MQIALPSRGVTAKWPSLPHPAQGTAAPQCPLTFCGTLLPDMMKLMVYCFGFSLCLKCCSWLLLVVIHHYNHYILNSYHNDFSPHPQFRSLEITYVSVPNTAANTGHSCSYALISLTICTNPHHSLALLGGSRSRCEKSKIES